ncbi:helix-turn-helix domain-containing protein [Microbacterium elymi]|uniref:Helix-turn-helix domain-containing protein n=1 Tax=Microbacterium elymi TaxID=2909587 RepID=A0ABY5NGM2_9MICO|nr:helix-turn-helix domain-containing protein [Microbacterium elymi]UUT34305.1 helix-turn-helix domain-containing protein [Microbacterium elymi]
MSRRPTIPAEKKLRIVLSVREGEISIAEAARREKVSEQAIGNWKGQFLEGGKAGIEAGNSPGHGRPAPKRPGAD